MRQRCLPRTAGDRQTPPERVLAPQRGLESMGPILRSCIYRRGCRFLGLVPPWESGVSVAVAGGKPTTPTTACAPGAMFTSRTLTSFLLQLACAR